jgi:hypothetical protein
VGVLTLFAEQAESLWDEALPVEVRELPDDLAGLDRLLSDPALLGAMVARFREELAAGRSVIVGRAANTRDGDLCAVDGAQAALLLGLSDAGRGGLGLDPSAAVLPDLVIGAGSGRVDGPQAHASAGRRR